jgi:ribokinase
VCAWGQDSAAVRLQAALEEAGAQVRATIADSPTGRAIIVVSDGDNRIVVAPGSNAALTAADVVRALDEVRPTVVSAVLEVPLDAVDAAGQWAALHGVPFILNASPIVDRPRIAHILARADPLIVNRGEAQALLGLSHGTAAELSAALTGIARSAIVTDGAHGSSLADPHGVVHVPAASVAVADTTGGGDALAGTFAAALARGAEPRDALRSATDAATRLIATARRDRAVPH